MTRDDLKQMAREHLVRSEYTEFGWQECHRYEFDEDELERFATIVESHIIRTCLIDEVGEAIAREREACAKVCDSYPHGMGLTEKQLAQAIRARGQS